jgi:Predicted endonuclease distantly related to archaeal Holliday junction resolvase and Mrr-like restriction enzymes
MHINYWWLFVIGLVLGIIRILAEQPKRKRKKRKSGPKKSSAKPIINGTNHRRSKTCRPDDVILKSSLNDLSGPEFERLLALYFRDQGYEVHEVGVGGNDGGVDLIIINRRGERTAVQAKCYADHNIIPVQTVRELSSAKRNHNCIFSLLITTSDLSGPAKKEAEQFHVEYWHGGVIEDKLKKWEKWNPRKNKRLI